MNINKPEFKFKRTATVIDSMYIKDLGKANLIATTEAYVKTVH